ncbi:heme-degrading domain-containing protein [Variovorax sp. WS11]|uniref:heme-degrading domain-containing protein n=1 Tax=Variovorax sp. WS11 TaxID=1105204 RepID=UPI0015E7DF4E|nr:heme-degrading domain-containing protein [Variovorax sp. WS11]
MGTEQDIERMAEQERRLCFARFDNAAAWELGIRIKALCESRSLALAIEVRLMRETVFFYAMQGTSPENADWVRRKRNTVELAQSSSYAVGRALELEGLSLEQKMGLPLRDYATHGGGFPIRVDGIGAVGAVTISGAPQREDHAIVVTVLAELCGIPLREVALD